jgi:ABC-type transport system involved in multi-copper enzyme maturation permease subunit
VKTLWQVWAIARTEFRFALRRGAPVVVTAVIGLLLGTGILLSWRLNLQMADPNMEQYTPEQVQRYAENGITPEVYRGLALAEFADLTATDTVEAWLMLYLALLFLPIATAGTVSADRQFGVFELLRSMPMNGWTFLAGKVLGGIGIVLFIACFPFLVFLAVLEGIMLRFLGFGIPLELLALFIKLSILDGLPVLACGAALGVLAGVAFRSRRSAILPGLIAGILGIFSWLTVFRMPAGLQNNLDLVAYHVFQNYRSQEDAALARIFGQELNPAYQMSLVGNDAPLVGIARVIIMYVVVLAAGAGLFGLARLWLSRKENF